MGGRLRFEPQVLNGFQMERESARRTHVAFEVHDCRTLATMYFGGFVQDATWIPDRLSTALDEETPEKWCSRNAGAHTKTKPGQEGKEYCQIVGKLFESRQSTVCEGSIQLKIWDTHILLPERQCGGAEVEALTETISFFTLPYF